MKPPFLLLLLSLTFSLLLLLSLSSTTISAADILPGSTLTATNPNQSWSSPNNTFSLRFIPADDNPSTLFAAVTYDGIPIWTAGGTSGASDSTSSLQFLPDGNLRLVNGSTGAVVWQSNTAGRGISSAALDDSGNLVLRNGTVSIWSTFDNPTDTILPNQNFSVNHVLRSGIYSFHLLASGNLTLRWNNSVVYWNLGLHPSINNTNNLSSPTLGLQSIGILSLFDPMLPRAAIMAYSSDYGEGTDILRFVELDSDGNLRIYSSTRRSGTQTVRWAAVNDQCQVYGYCGNMGICSYNNSIPVCRCPSNNFEPVDNKYSRKGCKRKIEIADCPGNETMLQLDHAKFLMYPPEFSSRVFFAPISGCRLNCLVAESCVASTSFADGTGLCSFNQRTALISGYQSPAVPSTSYVKVCGPVDPYP